MATKKTTKKQNTNRKKSLKTPRIDSRKRGLIFALAFAIIGTAVLLAVRAEGFDVKAFLSSNVVGSIHEGVPHGVPLGYDWQNKAVRHSVTPPTADSGYMNLWGQMYVDQTNVRPANTRVSIAGCQLWGLGNNATTWTRLVNAPPGNLEGGSWSEDFTRNAGTLDIRNETDGTQSIINRPGEVAHFWTRQPLVNAGSNYRAFLVACSTRLVLADPTKPDDRVQSTYLLNVGADWRKSDYGCPFVNGITVCNATGQGKMIKVKNNWRRAVHTTMTSTELASFPVAPAEAFLNPDGTYGDTVPIVAPVPTPTPTPTPSPEPTPVPTPANLTLRGLVENQLVSGSIKLEAIPDGVSGITQAQFFVDDNLVTTETTAPWCLSGDMNNICNAWDTNQVPNGTHVFKVVLNHGTGTLTAQVTVNVQNTTIGGGTGLNVTFYSNRDFTGTSLNATATAINYNWGNGSPHKRKIGNDTFSARWTGKLQAPTTEKYTISTLSDDGVRVYLNNVLVIDNWTEHSATTNTASVDLEAGKKYDVKVEYFENVGTATMRMLWASPSIPQTVIPKAYLFTN